MRWSWVLVLGALGVAMVMAVRVARADAPALTWSSPDCASSMTVFETRLAALVTAEERARLSGDVNVQRSAGGELTVTLSLFLAGAPLGERRIAVKSCREAAETAAVTTSLAVFAGAETPPAPAASTSSSSSDLPQAPPSKPSLTLPPDAGQTSPARPVRAELRVGLLGSVEGGVLPSPAAGLAVDLSVVQSRWSLGLTAGGSAEQEVALSPGAAHLRSGSVAARGCWAPFPPERLRLDACVGARWWLLRGRGQGLPVNRAGSLSALAPLLGVGFGLRGPASFEWRLELEASAPLSRRRFMVGEREVARADVVAWSGRFGPVLRF